MQVQVHTNDKIPGGDALAQWVQQETLARLARFKETITRVEVYFSEVEGGRPGTSDKRCVMEARPAGRQPIAVNADAVKLADALAGALERLMRALDNDLGRAKDRHSRETIRAPE